MKIESIHLVFVFLLAMFTACGGAEGGSEFGNPSRPVIGTVVEDGGAALKKQESGSCPADTVFAADSLGNTATAAIGSACDFDLELTPAKAYVLSFTRDGAFVAILVVQNSSATLESTVFYLADGEDPVDLGDILIADGEGRPTNQPACQNDRDSDGENDCDDDDDDNDGSNDDDEEDCDLDGFFDDDDEDESECDEEEEGEGEGSDEGDILEVDPRNGEDNVGLTEEIEVRFDCTIDSSTATASTFRVAAGGDSISCEFEFSGAELSCEHEDDPFQADTTYTVTVNGVACSSGSPVETESWLFTTREN